MRSLLAALSACLLATPALGTTWPGVYTDATTYAPGDVVEIYASAPRSRVVYRLVRLGRQWAEVTRTDPQELDLQHAEVGSFLEVDGLTLAGRKAFTVEGWVHPTIIGGDVVGIAGHLGAEASAAGLLMTLDGHPAALLSDDGKTDAADVLKAPDPLDLDVWTHLAMTWDGETLTLYVDGVPVADRPHASPVPAAASPFRIGARAEAPGDQTGVLDGRLDAWAVWPRALSREEVEARVDAVDDVDDPRPPAESVDLYLGFEGPYPSVKDGSSADHDVHIVNYGTPGVSGVGGRGRGLRVNHDQIVDADWDVSARITVPPGTPSGLYAIQVLRGPDFDGSEDGEVVSARIIAVRPADGGPRAPIAVVVPTYTWTAYNTWPALYTPIGDGLTARPRRPGGEPRESGNNSAYSPMGDDASLAYHLGWRRPSTQASPMMVNPELGGYTLRGRNSMYLTQWLDARGYTYDVYTDDDLHAGRISAGEHRVLMPHGHHEYWTDEMQAAMRRFLEDGGSVIAPGGNMLNWRTVVVEPGVLEVRKFLQVYTYGEADIVSMVDGVVMGTTRASSQCTGNDDYTRLGVRNHLIKPCRSQPFCHGRWRVDDDEHWLWGGLDLARGDTFGEGRVAGSWAVGHETDGWQPGLPIPGLLDGAEPVLLATGVEFPGGDAGGRAALDAPDVPCETVLGVRGIPEGPGVDRDPKPSGSILYFPHEDGGHVLVIGASATPWALESDVVLSALLQHAIDCFVEGGCETAPPDPDPGTCVGPVCCGCRASPGPGSLLLVLGGLPLVLARRRPRIAARR